MKNVRNENGFLVNKITDMESNEETKTISTDFVLVLLLLVFTSSKSKSEHQNHV